MTAAEWKQITVEPYPKKRFDDAIMKTGDYQAGSQTSRTGWFPSKDTLLWLTQHGMKWEFAQLMATAIGGNRVYSGGLVLQSKAMGGGWVSMQMRCNRTAAKSRSGIPRLATALLTDASGAVTGVRTRGYFRPGRGTFTEQ